MERIKRLLNGVSKYGGWVFNFTAFIVSVIGLLNGLRNGKDASLLNEEYAKKYLFLVIALSYIFILIFYTIMFFSVKHSKNLMDKTNKKYAALNMTVRKIDEYCAYSNRITNSNISTISLHNMKYLNSFRIIEKRAGEATLIPTGDITPYTEEIKQSLNDLSRDFYSLYKEYARSLIDSVKNVIDLYLQSQEIDLQSGISLKLLSKTLYNVDSAIDKELFVYTAFRDEYSFRDKHREVGQRDYHIHGTNEKNGNSDFLQCLFSDNYIINNVNKTDSSYQNGNPEFPDYYNCAVTVPIFANYNMEKRFFGFFCCDVLNETYPDKKIFDACYANILFSAAMNMGMFFDSLNCAWKNATELISSVDNKIVTDYNTYIYNECKKNNRSSK
jgi:hypothetical protein